MKSLAKEALRAHFLQMRASISVADLAAKNREISEKLDLFFQSRLVPGNWTAYRAMPSEASLDAALPLLRKRGMEFCFPRVLNEVRGEMEFFRVADWEHDFVAHPWGMLEPKATSILVPKEKIVGALIPLLAFDRHGTRLGLGKAFYDHYLHNFSGRKIGIAFEWQFSGEDIPREGHDILLDAVVTDVKIHRFARVHDVAEE